ncbi:MAG TPA: cyclic pyranopterin monophosphate synthase MoaC, partial [Actinomycetota bacterium]|nr:cyclic pyranopterin monophosphate synthase MoaC [Actinomycetota bacterium]
MARILLFAAAREAAGRREDRIDAATVGEALKVAGERYGQGFERLAAICSVLRNGEVVARDQWWSAGVGDDDEIAILPPVSGGSDFAMIDVADKDETVREAVAVCTVSGDAGVVARLLDGTVKKGDAVGAAKVAATLAAKRTPELIPLC